MIVRPSHVAAALFLTLTAASHAAFAQAPAAPASDAEPSNAVAEAEPPPFRFSGYVEAFYQWNFNAPANGITNFRAFDNRHNSFTLANIALGTSWDYAGLIGRLTLQIGHTPSTYYLSEPSSPGTSGANTSDAELWKYLQEAYAGYRFGIGRGLSVTAGLFLSPIGPESMAVHDNWNWSNSNLFFGLPFYHTGVRASYPITSAWTVLLATYNGWNSVVDNNNEKTVAAQLSYTRPDLAAALLYLGGVERPRGAPEGRAWRNMFDGHVTWHALPWLSLLAHANGGFEPNRLGISAWLAGSVRARVQLLEPLFFTLRGDLFYEHAPADAAPLFWPAPWVSSGTATLDYRPHERASFRLEYRHDRAGADMFFQGAVAETGSPPSFIPDRAAQDTITLGATTWF